MDVIKLNIPAVFIGERSSLTWREVLFGIENELLAQGAAVDFASDDVVWQETPSAMLLELASVGKGEPTRDLVAGLAKAEPEQDENEIRGKWLYLVLAWIFEHAASYADPLRAVEEVYADFGYPSCIADLVRYMPSRDPDLGNRESNDQRLHAKWKRYLEAAADEYAACPRISP